MSLSPPELEQTLRRLYAAFNARDIDAVLAQLAADVDWPNAWEGGRVHGHAGVREYWTRQWTQIDPHVETTVFTTRADGRVAIDVHAVVRDRSGNVVAENDVVHVYTLAGDLVTRMDVEETPS